MSLLKPRSVRAGPPPAPVAVRARLSPRSHALRVTTTRGLESLAAVTVILVRSLQKNRNYLLSNLGLPRLLERMNTESG